MFNYFLRKPFGQELGRKIKIAFSNSDVDTAFTYIHDIGFIPKINAENCDQRNNGETVHSRLAGQEIDLICNHKFV